MGRQRASVGVSLAALIGLGVLATAPVAATEEPTYYLPAPEGSTLVVTQGNADAGRREDGRTVGERYAFDFAAAEDPERFPVLAARGGTVMGQRVGVRGGRCTEPPARRRPSCWRDVNYVLIDHGDGTSGLYMHMRRSDPLVRIGEVVSTGQRLGTAGTSGWTDRVGVQFQLQTTPTWDTVGSGGWFQTPSLPVAFSDADLLAQRDDGVPQAGDAVVSGNPGASFDPFRFKRRPTSLPASVPFEFGAERVISNAYDADSVDGYGLHFAPEVEVPVVQPEDPVSSAESVESPEPVEPVTGTAVRPLFGGELAFAGCATGESASLGRTVAISFGADEPSYLGVLGHLSDIDPTLLAVDPEQPTPIVGPNVVIGHYGAILGPDDTAALECPEADPAAADLFVTILRDATITPEGEIVGGTAVSPEPLVGKRGYEGLAWWPGPVAAVTVAEEPGQPRPRWNRKTTAQASHVAFGNSVLLRARVVDRTDIAEVRFRAWYPRWPRVGSSGRLDSFDPNSTWRQLAVCTPPGVAARSKCTWNGDAQDALVTFTWDPTATAAANVEDWLPRARTAMTRSVDACVPVSLAVEVVDTAGKVYSDVSDLPRPARCDLRSAERADNSRLVYLDPLVPPRAPTPRSNVENDRGWPAVYDPDPLNGAIVWRDRSNNEDGFRIYARRSWFQPDCSVTDGPWSEVIELPADRIRYRPRHNAVVKSIKVPNIKDVPGSMVRWEYAVAAFNEAGTTKLVPVGTFLGGSEAFCDTGLEPPPEQ
jgi:hypothetical protein